DEALLDGLVQRGPQGRADALLGGRADHAPSLDLGAQSGVSRFAGGDDLFIELVDGVEDPVDVGDAEPFQQDVPEVGFEVQLDVAGVGAAGAFAQVPASGQPGLQVLPHGDRPAQVLPGADFAAHLVGVGQRPGGAAGRDDQVGDLQAGRVIGGDGQEFLGAVQLGVGDVLGGEPAPAQRAAPGPGGGGREFELVVPRAVGAAPAALAAPQLRAFLAEQFAVLVAASAGFERASLGGHSAFLLVAGRLPGGRARVAAGGRLWVEAQGGL